MDGITESLTVFALTVVSQLLRGKLLLVVIGRLYCAKRAALRLVMGHVSHVPPPTRLPHGGAGVCAGNAMPGE